jgi:hypothetical protein
LRLGIGEALVKATWERQRRPSLASERGCWLLVSCGVVCCVFRWLATRLNRSERRVECRARVSSCLLEASWWFCFVDPTEAGARSGGGEMGGGHTFIPEFYRKMFMKDVLTAASIGLGAGMLWK